MRRMRQSLVNLSRHSTKRLGQSPRRAGSMTAFCRGFLGVEIGGSALGSLFAVGHILARCPTLSTDDLTKIEGHSSRSSSSINREAPRRFYPHLKNRGIQMSTSTNEDILRALYRQQIRLSSCVRLKLH